MVKRIVITSIALIVTVLVAVIYINMKATDIVRVKAGDVYTYDTKPYSINMNIQTEVKEASASTKGLEVEQTTTNVNATNTDIWSLIQKYSTQYSLDPLGVAAICAQETSFGQNMSTSNAGAQGLMQIKPTSGPVQQLKEWGRWESSMTNNLADNDNNMHIACAYLKGGMDYFVIPAGKQNDFGALAAGYNSWWASTIKNDPPYLHNNTENKNYYYECNQRYADYKSGKKQVGVR